MVRPPLLGSHQRGVVLQEDIHRHEVFWLVRARGKVKGNEEGRGATFVPGNVVFIGNFRKSISVEC